MKVVIFAGGLGTRISEESVFKPKPLIEIGGKPILWHIMKIYSSFGFNDFIILGGYKQEMIKKYFQDYFLQNCDVTFNYKTANSYEVHKNNCEKWNVTVLDTGYDTMTGGRLLRAKEYIGNETFMLTYGDGVGNIDINELIKQHKQSNGLVTLTAIQAQQRFGVLDFSSDTLINSFREKPKNTDQWINAGFFVCEPEIFDYISGDTMPWEDEPLKNIAADGKLFAYKHDGFWMPMDTLKDKTTLEKIWKDGNAPWKLWN